MIWRWLLAFGFTMAVLASCGVDDDGSESSASTTVETGDDSESSDTDTDDSDTESSDTETAEGSDTDDSDTDDDVGEQRASVQGVPDSAVGRQFETLLTAALSGTLEEDDVEARLADVFLEQVSASSFISMSQSLPGLIGVSPVIAGLDVNAEHVMSGWLLNSSDGSRWAFVVGVEVAEPHKVITYSIGPFQEPPIDRSITDLAAVADAWSALAPVADLFVAELDGSDATDLEVACGSPLVQIRSSDPDGPGGSIGSAFKLYVLAAVATAVDNGTVSWSDELTITDELKSLPSGQLQVESDGTTLDVATAAELMLGISDNTATDLLIDLVGREAVEAELAVSGHGNPEANRPFFTTRELFQLKLGDPIRLGLVQAGDEAERRELLADLADEGLPELTPGAFTEPNAIDVEWLATTADLCRVLVSLDARGAAHPEILRALRAGRGSIDGEAWPNVGFKGGSEPGVLSLNWLAERDDGQRFVVSGVLNNPDAVVDEAAAVYLALRLFELLAEL